MNEGLASTMAGLRPIPAAAEEVDGRQGHHPGEDDGSEPAHRARLDEGDVSNW